MVFKLKEFSEQDIFQLESKWKNSGMLDCTSMSEFLLRLEILQITIQEKDLIYLADIARNNSDLCNILAELAENTKIFDCILSNISFYNDYYLATMNSESPDPLKYGHINFLDIFLTFPSSNLNKDFLNFLSICLNKVDLFFDGKLESINYFKKYLNKNR